MPAELIVLTLTLIGLIFGTAFAALRRIEREGFAVAERARLEPAMNVFGHAERLPPIVL